ncbi:MAG: hypothetical protein J6589_09590 [Snodgrassella sp.]|uniref:hypothetical protein n=1 Tax=Snodgrassella sp. TaxID=2815304 RepID=UPI0025832AB3|nr:hypothetical protein [Snodgrassella sp.]MCO6514700.1 hypothetical protein [Snodgrassella sp.]MCO6520502.1 hypothetical protein [Snodgrassella sp.]
MNNFLKWYSFEKDGPPRKDGRCLIYIETTKHTKHGAKHGELLDVDYYYLSRAEWEWWDRGEREDRHLFTITHYIPLSEIPMPK